MKSNSRSHFPSGFIIGLSLAIHLALIAVFAFGWKSEPEIRSVKTPRYIEAKLVTVKRQAKKVAATAPAKVDLTKKKKVTETKKPKNQPPKKTPAEKKPPPKKVDTKKEDADRQREKQRMQKLQQEMEKALKEEEAVLAEEEFEIAAQSYIDVISQRVEQNWSRPPSARNGMRCELLIQLVPTGRVVSVSIVKSSGNSAFDRSAERAVQKVEHFPEVKDMSSDVFERYYRRFKLVFNPQDLRQ